MTKKIKITVDATGTFEGGSVASMRLSFIYKDIMKAIANFTAVEAKLDKDIKYYLNAAGRKKHIEIHSNEESFEPNISEKKLVSLHYEVVSYEEMLA